MDHVASCRLDRHARVFLNLDLSTTQTAGFSLMFLNLSSMFFFPGRPVYGGFVRGLNLSSMFFSGRPVYGGFVRGNRPKVKNQRQMVKAVDREAEKAAKTAMRRRDATARKAPTRRIMRAWTLNG